MEKQSTGKKHVLIISAVITGLFVLYGIIAPESLSAAASWSFSFLTAKFGWLYLLSVTFFVLFAIGLAVSRYGKIKLGKDDDKPEFSNFQWFAMLFGGGMGIGLVFWSVSEPMMHYLSPPMADAGTQEAMYEAMRTVFFHWGIHPWAVYAIGGLALAYFQFRKGLPFLVSSAFQPLLGDRINGPIGKTIDILAVFATIFGVATSLGLGAAQIVGGLNYIWGIENSTALTAVTIAIITLIFTVATASGLHKAMQFVANFKVWLSVAFMVFIFIFGGSVFILNIFTNTTGTYFANIIQQSLWMENESFIQGWTVFYWAWWIAWAPFVGQFVARVSKGRSIREFLLSVLLLPAGFGFIWLSIYGGAAFNLDALSGGALQTAIGADYTTGLFAMLQQMPLYFITGPLAILLIVVCFVGAADSATYVLAMITSNGDMNPSKRLRTGWGIAQGAVTTILIIAGGTAVLSILQTVSIVAAFPFMFVMLFMCYSIMKALRSEPALLVEKRCGDTKMNEQPE